MKQIKRYYQGPTGVFYNPKFDYIFELAWTGKELCNRNGKIIGRIYQLNRSKEDSKIKNEIAIVGMESAIRLGDL